MRYIWKENDVLGVTYKARSKNRTLFLLEPKVFSLDYTDYEVIIKKHLIQIIHKLNQTIQFYYRK